MGVKIRMRFLIIGFALFSSAMYSSSAFAQKAALNDSIDARAEAATQTENQLACG